MVDNWREGLLHQLATIRFAVNTLKEMEITN